MATSDPVTENQYVCPKCLLVIGRVVSMKDLGIDHPMAEQFTLLVIGGMVIEHAKMICPTCGNRIYYDINDQRLDRLVRMVTKEGR